MSDVRAVPLRVGSRHLATLTSNLIEGIAAGCEDCVLLRDVISRFFPFSEVDRVHIMVDCALYVHAFFKEVKGRHTSVEVYTMPDTCARPHLKQLKLH
jgi:hypothetical protein